MFLKLFDFLVAVLTYSVLACLLFVAFVKYVFVKIANYISNTERVEVENV